MCEENLACYNSDGGDCAAECGDVYDENDSSITHVQDCNSTSSAEADITCVPVMNINDGYCDDENREFGLDLSCYE